jgi:hypothetical protein
MLHPTKNRTHTTSFHSLGVDFPTITSAVLSTATAIPLSLCLYYYLNIDTHTHTHTLSLSLSLLNSYTDTDKYRARREGVRASDVARASELKRGLRGKENPIIIGFLLLNFRAMVTRL